MKVISVKGATVKELVWPVQKIKEHGEQANRTPSGNKLGRNEHNQFSREKSDKKHAANDLRDNKRASINHARNEPAEDS